MYGIVNRCHEEGFSPSAASVCVSWYNFSVLIFSLSLLAVLVPESSK